MKVSFIHFLNGVMPSYSHAIASLAASLIDHDVKVVTIRDSDINKNASDILADNPDVVLMSIMSNQYRIAENLCKALKESREIKVWVGGSHINAAPHSFYHSSFDAACYGEGEGVLPEALYAYERGLIYDQPSWITKNKTTPLEPAVVENLDALPLPRIDLFERSDILTYPSVMFSRGCPYGCTYCLSRRGGIGGQVRWKSVEKAISETSSLVEFAKPAEIYFDDDTFLKNPKWVKEYLGRYRDEIGLPFYCNSRPEAISKEICDILAKSGCAAIGIGVESGSEKIRKEILNRNLTDEQIIKSFGIAKAAGLQTWSFNMIGIPGENLEHLKSTIHLNEAAKVDFVRVSVYTPYPGTLLDGNVDINNIPTSYFDALNLLTDDMRELASSWVSSLKENGQLWNDDI
ncbi:MAG: B12-binding domain-containing radical SAM protein [Chloroflexi bacterium]|nr:B12-binding domain-containing radical SAM protein [Chloroflexota bacterium]